MAAAGVLAACLFLPFTTCSDRGRRSVAIPVRALRPLATAIAMFAWPIPLLVIERRVRRRWILVALQVPAAALDAALLSSLVALSFGAPAVGFYVAEAALVAILGLAIAALFRPG